MCDPTTNICAVSKFEAKWMRNGGEWPVAGLGSASHTAKFGRL